jgi:Family of unknown function (DUF6510)
MDALDGNSIAGPLEEHFGAEMTTASGRCTHCGAVDCVARLRVYSRAPGAVARCASCGNVVLVVVEVRGAVRVHMPGFELAEPSSS